MDVQLKDQLIAVGGATSGLGRAVCEQLMAEGARVIGTARTQAKLEAMANEFGDQFIPFAADVSQDADVDRLIDFLQAQDLYGCCLNAGGPPLGPVADMQMTDWDQAYASTLRWKVKLTMALLPQLQARERSRLIYIESRSIKQPINNLVLSNAYRAAVAAFVKTLVNEQGATGLTCNIIGPGFHATPRIESIIQRKADEQQISYAAAEAGFAAQVPTGRIGRPNDLGSLVTWLMSPYADYMTGQIINVDGGTTKGAWG